MTQNLLYYNLQLIHKFTSCGLTLPTPHTPTQTILSVRCLSYLNTFLLIQVYIIYTIHVLLSPSIYYFMLCTLSKAIKKVSNSLSLSLSLSHTHTHTHTHLKHFKFTKYKLYSLFYVCAALSLSCCQSIIYIFPSQSHCNTIHWQVKLSSTNLLLLCFSLNIRTKSWVLGCSMSHKIQQGSCLWSTL